MPSPRKPREDLVACKLFIQHTLLRYLDKRGMPVEPGVTSGWLWDRQSGSSTMFSLFAIETSLRQLVKEKRILRIVSHVGGNAQWKLTTRAIQALKQPPAPKPPLPSFVMAQAAVSVVDQTPSPDLQM